MAYTVHAWIDSNNIAGMTVYDWFEVDERTHVLDREYETVEEAEAALQAAYKGADVDGVDVRWEILT